MKLVIHTKDQKAELYDGERLIDTFPVSTAAKGLGCEEGSYCTPPGRLKVAKKIGHGAAPGTVFRARVPTGAIWSDEPGNPLANSSQDLVLTRILWLEGCDEANANTFQRYIYLHGTNQEHLLGTPASHGCIRFSNRDIAIVFGLLEEGAEVEVI